MYRALSRLIMAAVLVGGGWYTWKHFHQVPASQAAEEEKPEPPPKTAEEAQSQPFVKITGPLAKLMGNETSSDEESPQPLRKPSPKDHVEDSPVGTSSHILHKTFAVARAVHLAFEIPPHAVTPHFHGTFCSFVQGESSHDARANVDMLLMNEQQYAQFIAGRDPDVLYIADTSHYQDVDYDLSPSLDQTVKYHLVFRNTPGGAAKKLVQADFTVDF
jgi:hypothetical protein